MSTRIRVVITDASPFVCKVLALRLRQTQDLEVVATASTGAQAIEAIERFRPDVATMDIQLPDISGLHVLEHVMRVCPTPVLVLTGGSRHAAEVAVRSLDLGAVDVVLKYSPGADVNPAALAEELVLKLRMAAQVRVVRSLGSRRPLLLKSVEDLAAATREAPEPEVVETALRTPLKVIVVGASTGGPAALRELLAQMPAQPNAALVLVQHLSAAFTGALAEQLDRHVPLGVREARDGDRLQRGLALLAPGDRHLLLHRGLRVELSEQAPSTAGPLLHRPSIDVAMGSAAQAFRSAVVGVLLTGMGQDGVEGLAQIQAVGGRTYAQELESCVVPGMPQRAIERGVVGQVAAPAELGRLLASECA